MSAATDPRVALYQCALGIAKDAMEAFTDPLDRMPADTGEFRDLKIALVGIRQTLPVCSEYKAGFNFFDEIDRLKALNAKLAEALELMLRPWARDPDSEIVDGSSVQIARAALKKHQGETA